MLVQDGVSTDLTPVINANLLLLWVDAVMFKTI